MRTWVVAVVMAVLSAAPAAAGSSMFWVETKDLGDATAVVRAMRDRGAQELPVEALALYEQGLAAMRAGDTDRATALFTSASWVDPSFPEAHLALARIQFLRNPGAALQELGAAFTAASRSFGAQHLALVNVMLGTLVLVLLTGVIVLFYILGRLLARLHHVIAEILQVWLPGRLAWAAAGFALAAPFFWRVGILPVLLLAAGSLWFWMSRGERRWTLVVAGYCLIAPAALWVASPVLFSPLDPGSPSFLISRAMVAPATDGLIEEIESSIERDPENPRLHFALGMLEKRRERIGVAREAYDRSLALGGPEAIIHNNLGVIEYHAGRFDEAIAHFRSAVDTEPELASAHYNLSQAYAKRLFFDKADIELREANRLAFHRIREVIKTRTGGTNGTLLDESLPAKAYWMEASAGPRILPSLPPSLAILFPSSPAFLPVFALLFLGAGLLIGSRLHASLPSFACSNCGRPVCRRCLRRIKRQPFCRTCGETLLRIQSLSYSRLVLDARLKRGGRLRQVASRVSGLLLPGYHALRLEKPTLAAGIAALFALGMVMLASGSPPVTRLGWLDAQPDVWWPGVPVALLILAEGISAITVWKLDASRAGELSRALAAADDDDLDLASAA